MQLQIDLYLIVSGKPCRLEAEGKKKVFHRRDEGGGCNGDIKVLERVLGNVLAHSVLEQI